MTYTDEEFLAAKDYFLAIREAALKIRGGYGDPNIDSDEWWDSVDDLVDLLDEGEMR